MAQSDSEDWMQSEVIKRQQIDSGRSFRPWSWPYCFESVEHHGADGIRAAYLTAAEKQTVTQEKAVGKAYVLRRCPKWWNFPHYLLTAILYAVIGGYAHWWQHNYEWSQCGEQTVTT